MNTIQNLFQQSQLAEAAYVNFYDTSNNLIATDAGVKAALTNSNFSDAQATDFITHWRVVSQQPNTTSGFSATVFQRIDSDPANGITAGQYFFVIRGSENFFSPSGMVDWFAADAHDLGGYGLSLHQAIDLYNYIQSLKTPTNTTYQAAYLKTDLTQSAMLASLYALGGSLNPAYNIAKQTLESLGYWVDGATVSKIALGDSATYASVGLQAGMQPTGITATTTYDVIGHSLGGHLAMIMQRLDPNFVSSVQTFNPPFFDPFTSSKQTALFFSQLQQAEIAAKGSSDITGIFETAFYQHYVVNGDVVHDIGTVQPGATNEMTIFTESQDTNAVSAHKIGYITDSLAVYNLLATLDPSLNTAPNGLAKITDILKAETSVAANTLESTINALGNLFVVSGTTFFSNEFDNNRDLLYSSIDSIVAALPTNGGLSLVAVDPATILTSAKADATASPDALAYRYALVNGNPFVVKGADYGIHNNNGELNLFNTTDHSGSLTNQYLQDRANYLAWQLKANQQDVSTLSDVKATNTEFQDIAHHDTLTLNRQILGFNDTSPARKIIFGSDLSEDGSSSTSPILQGGSEADHIYGMGGDDKLQGNGGNDYLEGGLGNDTYIWNTGDGFDSIRDTDGLGSIVMDGQTLAGGKQHGDARTFTGKDASNKEHTYAILSGDISSAGGATLLIDNTIEVFNFRQGDLGITLGDATPAATTPSTYTAIGDPVIHNAASLAPGSEPTNWYVTNRYNYVTDANGKIISYDADYFLIDGNGNPTETGGPARADTLHGTSANDHLMGMGGNDTINATTGGGNDILDGGSGRDLITAGAGNDILIGGSGGDILDGGLGNDLIYADSQVTTQQAIADGNSQAGSGLQGDWLTGGSGNDTLVGSAGNDVLMGGGGSDLLIGGAGNDDISGDANWLAQSFDWTVTDQPQYRLFQPAAGDSMPADAAADTIYAGAGDDHAWGGLGNDTIYGEGGNDILSGNDGSDTLFGGAGNDIINGDGVSIYGQTTVAEGNDYIDGGDGNDKIWGNGGNDTILGGAGDDQLMGDNGDGSGAQGNDYIDGGGGNDKIWGEGGDDTLFGGTGDDQLSGGTGANYLDGGDGNDILVTEGDNGTLLGGAGDDQLGANGGVNNNYLDGGAGNDTLVATGNNNYLDGGADNNTVQAVGNNNELFAGSGNDSVAAWGDGNYLDGGDGSNTVQAVGNSNDLFGGIGSDTVQAWGDNNYLDGGDGSNTVDYFLIDPATGNPTEPGGPAHADTLTGSIASDHIMGGGGVDRIYATQGGNDLIEAGGGNGWSPANPAGYFSDYVEAMNDVEWRFAA